MNRIKFLLLAAMFTPGIAISQDKYAITVGAEVYDTSTFRNLDWSHEDANELAKSLESHGFQTTVMTCDSRSGKLRPSSPERIERVVSSVAASCTDGDTLIVSLTGHGVQFSDEDLLPTGVRETYFCPSDADLSDKSTLLKVSRIVEMMQEAKATQKLLLIDACQEHVLSTNGNRKNAKRIELGSIHESRRSVPGGMTVLFSCKTGQFSWEHDDIQHSVFSYHIIRYLNGLADSRFYTDGKIDLFGLQSYVAKRTNEYVINNNLDPDGQLPVLRGDSTTWHIGDVTAPSVRTHGGMIFHRVLPDVWFGETEVTRSQWTAIMKTSPWGSSGPDGQLPATRVSWETASQFCDGLTAEARIQGSIGTHEQFAIPSLEHWRKIADSAVLNNLKQTAWTSENSEKQLKVAGSLKRDPNKLFDFFGNVWEWCDSSESDKPACGGSYKYPMAVASNLEPIYYASNQAFEDIGLRVSLVSGNQ